MGNLKHMPATPMSREEMEAQCDLVADACDDDLGELEEVLRAGRDPDRKEQILKDVAAQAQSILSMVTDFGPLLTTEGMRLMVTHLSNRTTTIVERLAELFDILEGEK